MDKVNPKKDSIQSHKDLGPITIMNTIYRLLFNIIATKLKPWAKHNINHRQQAFIAGRQVNNHVYTLQGLRQLFGKSGIAITNLDIENAYDGVEPEILQAALKHCKFPPKLTTFILNAYSNHTCSIEWNGELTTPFTKTRGVPQGCPFAPLAYNLVTQIVIDKSIEKWKIPNQITTVSIDKIGSLNFADDLYLIGKPNEEQTKDSKISIIG